MIALSQSKTKRLVALHGWSGVLLSILLYVVVLSGTVVVMAHEIGIWSAGNTSVAHPLEKPVDHIVRSAAKSVPPKYYDEIRIRETVNGELSIFFHTHVKDTDGNFADKGIRFIVNPVTQEVISRREGFVREVFGDEPKTALERFLLNLHIRLHIPGMLGLLATGILGLWMMVAGISGLLAHRHVIRDMFVPERSGDRLAAVRDRHALAGSWSLIFAFLLAFTGSFFSFAGSIGIPVVGMVATGGDQRALVERIIGINKPDDPRPAALASLDYMVMDSTRRAGTAPDQILITHYGRRDASVRMLHPASEGSLMGQTLLFEGPSRTFEGVKPFLGTVPSVSNTAVGLMGPLHFGDFAGMLSKIVWVALGSAMTFVILTGTRLWIRRRAEEPAWQAYRRIMVAVMYGFPIAMVACAYGFFLALPSGETHYWTAFAFIGASVLCLIYGWRERDVSRSADRLCWILAISLIALPLVRLLMGGTAWSEAMISGRTIIPSIDILLVMGGLMLLRWGRVASMFSITKPDSSRVLGPAE
ncbi:MAG: PepSY-associated TM helix domain-containing protein [Pseudomonadota bacterium]